MATKEPHSRLTIGFGDYDRTRALRDGRVGIEGYRIEVPDLSLKQTMQLVNGSGEIDVCEYSMLRFMVELDKGGFPYIGLPIFPARSFRHSAIYVRSDRIQKPRDLSGRIVGLNEYSNTASLVVRTMLKEEFGVSAESVSWRVGDIDQVVRTEIRLPQLPPSIDIQALPGRSLSQLLAEGAIDALIAFQPPSCFGQVKNVARLFPDWRTAEMDYFEMTGIFPIMHTVLMRRELAQADPSLPERIASAFARSAQLALVDQGMSSSWPPIAAHFWPQGTEQNCVAIEALLRSAVDQHLTSRLLDVQELFPLSNK